MIIAVKWHTHYCYRIKAKLSRSKGIRRESIPAYLDEFMWRERYGKTTDDAFNNILGHITERHPLP